MLVYKIKHVKTGRRVKSTYDTWRASELSKQGQELLALQRVLLVDSSRGGLKFYHWNRSQAVRVANKLNGIFGNEVFEVEEVVV